MEKYENVVLHNWGGYDCNVELDENIKDISTFIKYDDHGDEFLVVGTKDGSWYEYGLFITRRDYPDDPKEGDPEFVKIPKIPHKLSDYTMVSNNICRYEDWYLLDNRSHFMKRLPNKEDAKRNLHMFLYSASSATEKIINKKIKDQISRYFYDFVAINELDVEEDYMKYKDELNEILSIESEPFYAGKRNLYDYICGDYIQWIWHNGEYIKIKKKKLGMKTYYDEWGSRSFDMPLSVFA